MTAKPPRAERVHSKAYRLMLTREEMDVIAAVAGRYFDSMREAKVPLPAKVSLHALHVLHKFKAAIRDTNPIVVIDVLPPELQEAGAAIESGASLGMDAIDAAIADPSTKTPAQILEELEARIVSAREDAQRAKSVGPSTPGAGMAAGYLEALVEVRHWILGGDESGQKARR